ncbi:MAG: ABC transporter ATP-binding protein [bacterium]
MQHKTRLQAQEITLSYESGRQARAVIDDLSLEIPDGRITSIIGPNGCGKSTLLRALSRLMTPKRGTVVLDGEAIHRQSTREVARRLGILSQQPTAPEAITVEDLARRGRYPHHGFFAPPSDRDRAAVEHALALAGVLELRARPVDELSGGQRQRAWIAMALAQEPGILLFDEPTTYLDLAHQQEVLSLVRRLNRDDGRTIVLVLHDVNTAATVSDRVVAMRDGRIFAQGNPTDVLKPMTLEHIFAVSCDVIANPKTGRPVSIPRTRIEPSDGRQNLRRDRDDIHPPLRTEALTAGYHRIPVIKDITIAAPAGRVTAIIGPNACGKSTLLRACSRLLSPIDGFARLNGQHLQHVSHRTLARSLALLMQSAAVPPGVTVEELVGVGRFPYQRWYRQWSRADKLAVDRALAVTAVEELRSRPIDTLSGGQRQRVWIAMALAQETDVLFLDEPTTFLDIAHQVETLDLIRTLNRSEGRTVVMVLHDLGHACRYADHLIVMKDGRVAASGTPRDIVTEKLVRDVFGVESAIVEDPIGGGPLVLPLPDVELAAEGSVSLSG